MQFAKRGDRWLLAATAVAALSALLWFGLTMGDTASAAAGHGKRSAGLTHRGGHNSQARRHHGHGQRARGHRARGAHPASITSVPWGTANGQAVRLYTLDSGNGMTVHITNYGGVVQSIWVPGRTGQPADVALGFPKLSDYVNDVQNQPWPAAGGSGDTYFGGAIGRYANRIADHSFTLNGTTYQLVGNNGPNNVNTLHGGPDAWNTAVWSAQTRQDRGAVSLVLTHVDPDGYNGFPGQVTVTLTYTLTRHNALRENWSATTTKPTVINVTSHIYFNLAGEGSGSVDNQLLQINSNTFQPTNAVQIPTGQFVPVAGTPFDFRHLHPIGQNILRADLPWGGQLTVAHGYDFNWVLNGSAGRMKEAALAVDPASGREVTAYTTEPGLQVYTGNFLVGDLVGTSGHIYRQTSAFTLETQHYPDSPHHIGQANWPSVVLNPGQTFHSTTVYQFGVTRR
ncbi:MAG: aldose epimerase family protein [Solirubrobacteraceae bacterium]